jgi:iron complex outermembrane recepter protein
VRSDEAEKRIDRRRNGELQVVKFRSATMAMFLAGVSIAAAILQTTPAVGQIAANDSLQEIIVTAEKRSENINNVGMSIDAISGSQLVQQGFKGTDDLVRDVPGFNYTQSSYGVPVYTMRGIGYYDSSLGASPTVSLYVDQVPLPFSIMTTGATLDLERVEVLKGPQGTLFGENSTGGAINYIAAKPTTTFEAGADGDFSQYGEANLQGFVSGPLSDTVSARLSMRVDEGGDWQKSYTRDDSVGATRLGVARLLVDWTPNNDLKVSFNFNGWHDNSDTQAAQFIGIGSSPSVAPAAIINFPHAPSNDRAADWDAGQDFRRNDSFGQGSIRADYKISDQLTLTSITAYEHLTRNALLDVDGTDLSNLIVHNFGQINSYYEEDRLSGDLGRVRWLVGGSYAEDHIVDNSNPSTVVSSFPFKSAFSYNWVRDDTSAIFGNVDWLVAGPLTIQTGVRYTKDDMHDQSCTGDTGDDTLAPAISGLASALSGHSVVIPAGGCATLSPTFVPGPVIQNLDQDNVSWRVNANWQLTPSALLYANVSRGYKGGSFGTSGAIFSAQLQPASQESVLGYETGFKVALDDNRVQLNGSVFYYDYTDKQVRGRIIEPVIGALNTLLNIPSSRVVGTELQMTWLPIRGLHLTAGGTYIDSRIGSFVNSDALGNPTNLTGESFPLTPKVQLDGDAEYEFAIAQNLNAFLGAHTTYQSATNAGLGDLPIFAIDAYALVDARLGIRSANGKWSVGAYVDNLTNRYYWTYTSFSGADAISRYAGRPETAGVRFSYRY